MLIIEERKCRKGNLKSDNRKCIMNGMSLMRMYGLRIWGDALCDLLT